MSINFNPNQAQQVALPDQNTDGKCSLFFLIKSFYEIVNSDEQCTCLSVAKKVLNIALPIIAVANLLLLPFIAAYNCCFAHSLETRVSPENNSADEIGGDSQNSQDLNDLIDDDAQDALRRKNISAALQVGVSQKQGPVLPASKNLDVSEKENFVGGNAGEELIGEAPVNQDALVESLLPTQMKSESVLPSLDAEPPQIDLLKEEVKEAPVPPRRKNLNASNSPPKLQAGKKASTDSLEAQIFGFFAGQ